MKLTDLVKIIQDTLNRMGESLTVDGQFGPKTSAAAEKYTFTMTVKRKETKEPVVVSDQAPWQKEMLKHKGKVETDSQFQAFMNRFWILSGLPNFKGLVGSARAWCGLFVFMGLYLAGYATPKNAFRAIAWDTYGQAINWKTDGIPQGAIIRINSSGNCSSASGNHVTTANGYCTASDLTKSGATIGAYGGNQANSAKVSIYKMSTVCAVRWPSEFEGKPVPRPAKVLASNNCTGTGSTSESTR